MFKKLVRCGMVLAAVGFVACDESSELTSPNADGETVFDPVFSVTGPPDGGTCPEVYYEESELLDNGVTLTWTSVLANFDYTEGADYTPTVMWSVDQGSTTYNDFTGRNPKSKMWTPIGNSGADVDGVMTPGADGAGTLDVTVSMTPMHAAAEDTDSDEIDDWFGQIGNGHFWLRLSVDDGEGNVENVKLGVNFHFEDPDDGSGSNCPS